MRRDTVRKNLGTVWIVLMLLACGASPSRAYQQDLKKMASDLATRMHAMKHSRVTVVDFVDLDGKPTKLGKFLAQQLQLGLAEPELQLTVVDQSQLSQLLDQVELLNEGLLDPTTGRKIGQMTGAEVIVLGTIMPASVTVRLDIKAIDLQTAKVITGGTASVPRTGVVSKLANESQGEEEETTSVAAAHPVAQSAKAKAPARIRRDQGMVFELDGCSTSADELTCAVTVTSEDRDRWFSVEFGSRAWNHTGDEYSPSEVTIANSNSSQYCATKQVLKEVPTPLSLTFPNYGDDAGSVERLRIYWTDQQNCWGDGRPVNFEKIALSEDADFTVPQKTAHTGKAMKGVAQEKTQGKGGFLQKLGNHVLGVVESAAEKVIDKKTKQIVGEDEEEEGEDPPNNN
jgi:hypothetical protein